MAKKSMILKQQAEPKFSSRRYNRCKICGRPHGYLRNYGVTFLLAAVLSTPLLAQLEARWGRRLGWLKNLSLLVVLIASIAYLEDATYNPFLYFRF